ncbi:G kinase-anchoring protein 1 isoform X2 [Parasteatoda tepidariorum]|uniref:G kinase-anchoring protein 1 isoform X2 n=1 Tax=Parasteatoda tepidariorum TaxID=114398 RepID=UPI001C7193D8|nr:G kinase-anchoring protein 1 isoform X2 [Parasteatoda tepidariorum]
MAVACASRFSVLKLEDDDVSESLDKKQNVSSQSNCLPGKSKGNSKTNANDSKSKSKKKKKSSNEVSELQNLAFGTHKSKHKSGSGNMKVVNASQKQWEEWKQKDSEVYDAIQRESENKNSNKKKKKNNQKKEKGTMSLDEFQSLESYQNAPGSFHKASDLDDFEILVKQPVVEECNFFDKIEEDAEKIITKEQKQEQYKINPVIESARLLQYQEDMRKKDEEIATLNESVQKLKEELKNVKSRNKKLYQILESGEMREKAEILVQIDQLTSVKDELTDQLSEYHTALEQERSKVHSLQMELKKFQNKKMRTESK